LGTLSFASSLTCTRALLPVGARLAIDVSDRVMEIETVKNSIDDEASQFLRLKVGL
jgi:hypothetical protein